MKLYLCEKPSQARDLARNLRISGKGNGFIGDNSIAVTWAIGHLIQQLDPDEVDVKYSNWKMEHLPIVPETWKMKPNAKTKKQLTVVKGLLQKSNHVVIATDGDREGEVIGRELLDYFEWTGNIDRLWLTALDDNSIQKALNNLKQGCETKPLYAAGLARARADWLVGMSATRALSLMAQKKGYRGVLSVGRVQTPTLAIVVNRDIEIENFKPKDYYDITGIFSNVVAQWIPARNTDSDVVVDVEGRCISEQYAKNITENILNNNHAVVENFTTQRKKVPPLLLHSIDTLQEQANKKFGFSSKQTLELARVVSFSGGRTSAMMLLQLLKKDELKQWRGDCVVFNNTSAEHSATYAFVSRIKKITEEKYNIPFFMTEFCTYEAKTNKGGYTRKITYKLVNDLPYCKHNNIHGYKFKGEVFEESISQTGVLPSTFQRNCTINMKILTTNNFLTDWMASKTYIDQQGEFSKVSNISDADIVKKHRIYNGELSDAVIIDKKTFVRSCQAFRPKQFFKDFTNADINYNNPYLKEKTTNGRVSIFGKDAIKYHNYIGIRFDEKHRAIKIRKRIKDAKTNLSRSGKNKISSAKTQPPFENANMPMIKAKINKQKVIDFWKNPARSKYDLDLPYDGMLSNCVHCMLKGKSKNQLISKKAQAIALDNTNALTPNSIKWWARIEQKYSRKVIKSDKNEYTNIGFFGASKAYVYQTWVDELCETNEEDLIKLSEEDSWNMDCNCTD